MFLFSPETSYETKGNASSFFFSPFRLLLIYDLGIFFFTSAGFIERLIFISWGMLSIYNISLNYGDVSSKGLFMFSDALYM